MNQVKLFQGTSVEDLTIEINKWSADMGDRISLASDPFQLHTVYDRTKGAVTITVLVTYQQR